MSDKIKKANDHFGKIRNQITYHPFGDPYNQSYSDGVKDLIEQSKALWLVEIIFREQYSTDGRELPPFQCWFLSHILGGAYHLTTIDGDSREVIHQKVIYGDFPYEKMTLWLIKGKLMFPSEFKTPIFS